MEGARKSNSARIIKLHSKIRTEVCKTESPTLKITVELTLQIEVKARGLDRELLFG